MVRSHCEYIRYTSSYPGVSSTSRWGRKRKSRESQKYGYCLSCKSTSLLKTGHKLCSWLSQPMPVFSAASVLDGEHQVQEGGSASPVVLSVPLRMSLASLGLDLEFSSGDSARLWTALHTLIYSTLFNLSSFYLFTKLLARNRGIFIKAELSEPMTLTSLTPSWECQSPISAHGYYQDSPRGHISFTEMAHVGITYVFLIWMKSAATEPICGKEEDITYKRKAIPFPSLLKHVSESLGFITRKGNLCSSRSTYSGPSIPRDGS